MDKFADNIEIGRRLREFRLKAGYTQERLAEALNMSPQQVQKYESGASTITALKLQQISKILSISVFAFFEGYFQAPFELTDAEKRLVDAYRSVPSEVKDGFLTCIEHAAQK